jgi:hypothetical protein
MRLEFSRSFDSSGEVDFGLNQLDYVDGANEHLPGSTNVLTSTHDKAMNIPATSISSRKELPEEVPVKEILPVSCQSNESQLKKKLAHWCIESNVAHTTVDKLLKILVSDGGLDLPTSARALLHTPRSNNIKKTNCGVYMHYGLEKALHEQLSRSELKLLSDVIEVDINIDGLPLAKSSRSVFWTILGRIYCKDLILSPFVIGVHHSYGKSTLTPHDLLSDLIAECKILMETGFEHGSRSFYVKIRTVICDTPARSFVTATKGHMGFNSCGRCVQRGLQSSHRILLNDLNSNLRTDDSFQMRADAAHHIGTSPFEELKLGMVSQFPLDYMHLVCLGVMKKMLLLWKKGNTNLKLPPHKRESFSRRLISAAPWISEEFVRKPRSFEDVKRYKATEIRLFLLYVGPSILHEYLPEKYLRHFLCFHVAMSILCTTSNCIVNNDYAKNLLRYFVKYFPKLYGKETVSYNVHNLIHLADDVKHLGCSLDSFSAFPFESHLGAIKRLMRKQEKPLAQLHNRLHERSLLPEPGKHGSVKYPVMLKQLKTLVHGLSSVFEKVVFEHFKLSTKSAANNCCYLRTKEILKVSTIGVKNGTPIAIGNLLKDSEDMLMYPLDSRSIDIHVGGKWAEEKMVNLDNIFAKAIRLPFNGETDCFFPMLHTLRQ